MKEMKVDHPATSIVRKVIKKFKRHECAPTNPSCPICDEKLFIGMSQQTASFGMRFAKCDHCGYFRKETSPVKAVTSSSGSTSASVTVNA